MKKIWTKLRAKKGVFLSIFLVAGAFMLIEVMWEMAGGSGGDALSLLDFIIALVSLLLYLALETKSKINTIFLIIFTVLTLILLAISLKHYFTPVEPIEFNGGGGGFGPIRKPVIYLYPEKTEKVGVRLKFNGDLLFSYPEYKEGWTVVASPDGNLVNLADNRQYSYLFWEGKSNYDFSKFDSGFVVKGSETRQFLQENLSKLGLVPKEYNEMIAYWLPQMEKNKYNLIHFAGNEYTQNAELQITPKPESVLRVFMVFKPLDKYEKVKTQTLNPFERKGFSVIEWGGTEVK